MIGLRQFTAKLRQSLQAGGLYGSSANSHLLQPLGGLLELRPVSDCEVHRATKETQATALTGPPYKVSSQTGNDPGPRMWPTGEMS